MGGLRREWIPEMGVSGYRWPGVSAPLVSATAMLGAVWPSPELAAWKLRQVAAAWRDGRDLPSGSWTGAKGLERLAKSTLSTVARDRGVLLHQAVEAMLREGPMDEYAPETVQTAAAVIQYLYANGLDPKVGGVELPVADPAGGWCGHIDFAGRDDHGVGWIADLKTGGRVWPSHRVQLGAYASARAALVGGRSGPMPPVGRVHIVHFPVKGPVHRPVAGGGEPSIVTLDGAGLSAAMDAWSATVGLWEAYRGMG